MFSVERMCRVLEVGRSGYYAWLKRGKSNRSLENELIGAQIRDIFYKKHQIYGSPRITEELRKNGVLVSRPRVARLMRKNHLRSKMKRKFIHTTDSKHSLEVSPNLLNRQFEAGVINRAWVSDITYIRTQSGWIYLTVIIDLGDRKVIGWAVSSSMEAQQTSIAAWKMAVLNRTPATGLIFHSDRGVQYAAKEFRQELAKHKLIKQSMSRKGNCWDNAPAEAFFKSLKTEWIYGKNLQSLKSARIALFEYIEIFYNRSRRHSTLGQNSPEEFLYQMNQLNHAA